MLRQIRRTNLEIHSIGVPYMAEYVRAQAYKIGIILIWYAACDGAGACAGIQIRKNTHLVCSSRQHRFVLRHTNTEKSSFGMPHVTEQERAPAYKYGKILIWYAIGDGAGACAGIQIWKNPHLVCRM